MPKRRLHRQLDLFAWRPKSEVIPAPVKLWGGSYWRGERVSMIASRMAEFPNLAEQYLLGSCSIIAEELSNAGASFGDVQAELHRYRQAVHLELARLGNHRNPAPAES